MMLFIKKGWLVVVMALLLTVAAGCSGQNSSQNTGSEAGSGNSSGSSAQAQTPAGSSSTGSTGSPGAAVGNPDSPVSSNEGSGAGAGSSGSGGTGGGTSDSASSGSALDNVTMGTVTAVRLIDPSSGWVGGKGWIARTDDGGKNWQVQTQVKTTVKQLFALNGQDAWAVLGTDQGDAKASALLQTTDGGKHWTSAGTLPNDGFLHFDSMKEAFAANAYSSDGGKIWTSLPVPDDIVGNAYFHDKQNGWAVVSGKDSIVVKRTTDGGKTWKTVLTRESAAPLNGAVIRSAGTNDAWVECIGDSGMSQTSYSLFHTVDGGDNWQTVIANATAGAGPAPGVASDAKAPSNTGSKPGPLYVVSSQVAFMGGYCPACDPNTNSIGWTTDGGKTWHNGKTTYPGSTGALLAVADAQHGWWICTDSTKPSVMYTTTDGGEHWVSAHTFDKPAQQ